MNTDAVRLEPSIASGTLVDSEGLPNVDAEFVFAQSRGYVWMCFGEDIWIHAERKSGFRLELARTRSEKLKFRFALYVKLKDSCAKSLIDLRRCFSDAGEHNAVDGLGSGNEHALQFAAGDDIKSSASLRKQLEDGEGGIGLDCVTHKMIATGKCLPKKLQALEDLVRGINVKRRTKFSGQGFERNFAAVEGAFGMRVMKGTGRSNGGRNQMSFQKQVVVLSLSHLHRHTLANRTRQIRLGASTHAQHRQNSNC